MSKEDARSLPGAAQAALRNRAVRAVLDGMSQVEAARVFGVHHNAVNRWISRYRQGGWDGLSERRRGRRPGEQAALSASQQREVVALVRETTPTSSAWRGSVDPRCGRRADRPPLCRVAGPHHGRRLRPGLGGQPAEAAAPGLEQHRAAVGRWLATEFPRSVSRPGGSVGWCGGWRRWGSVRMRRRVAPGRRSARPRSSRGPASGSGSPCQRHLQRWDAGVPAVCGVLQRPGGHRLPRPAGARLRWPQGAPDRGRASGAPRQAGQRLGWGHAGRIELPFLPG
jgi:transposase-like protein